MHKFSKAKVIIPAQIRPYPNQYETEVAEILVKHFRCSVEFLIPKPGYKMKTPDFIINSVKWELKCLFGKSKKNTLKFNLDKAQKQSRHIIIDSRHAKLTDDFIIKQLTRLFAQKRSIRKIILINKQNSVIDIKR